MRYLCVRGLYIITIFSLVAKIASISGFWRSWANLVQTRQVYVGNARALEDQVCMVTRAIMTPGQMMMIEGGNSTTR